MRARRKMAPEVNGNGTFLWTWRSLLPPKLPGGSIQGRKTSLVLSLRQSQSTHSLISLNPGTIRNVFICHLFISGHCGAGLWGWGETSSRPCAVGGQGSGLSVLESMTHPFAHHSFSSALTLVPKARHTEE